jgi:hypothetical protein
MLRKDVLPNIPRGRYKNQFLPKLPCRNASSYGVSIIRRQKYSQPLTSNNFSFMKVEIYCVF